MNRVRRCGRVVVALSLALTIPAVAGSQTCDQWQLVNPLPATSDLLGATYGNGLFVLVGREGTVLTSPDEVGWQLKPSLTTHDLHSVAWTGQRYVAVGSMGTVLTSEDGVSWSTGEVPVTTTLLDLAMGPVLVAVGSNGTIVTSPDGLSWTIRESGITTELRDVTWTGTEFLAVGDDIEVLASRDGGVWSMRDAANGGPFSCIASNTSLTIAVAEDGTSRMTTDGITWTRSRAPLRLAHMVWAGDRFIAIGTADSHGPKYSFDGQDWSYGQSGAVGIQMDVLATDGQITVAGGVGGAIAVTRDGGQHVKAANTITALDLYGLASKESHFVIASGTPTAQRGALLASEDGLNWEIAYDMGLETLYDVAANESVFVAVGVINELWSGGAMILRSPDGRSWGGAVGSVTGPGDWPWEWQSITWDGGRFVAAGSGGAVATSTDASSWHLIGGIHITDHTLFGVASDGQNLVAVGWTGAIAVSHDGQTLTMVHPGYEDGHLYDVAWGNGTFVAVGSGGRVLTSTNGDQWQEQTSGATVDLHGVRFIDGQFVAVGDQGAALTSTDGAVWASAGPAGDGDLLDAIGPGSELTAVGRNGLVVRSACAAPGQPPAPRFAWRPVLPEEGTPVHFVDLSLGDPVAWHWQFGDGGSSNQANTTHVFGEPGDWPVTMTAENEHGSATAYAPVTVRPFCGAPPATELTAPPSAASGEPYEISWTETLLPHQHGQYEVYESNTPDFLEQTGWGTWIYTSSEVTHQWTEGGSFFYRVRSINYCPDGDYRSPASNTARVDIEPDVTDLGDHVQIIAAAAHGSGMKNTSWVSDVVIHNPDRYAAPAYLFLLPRGGGDPPVGSPRHWVEAGQSLSLDDAVGDLRVPGAGALLVASDRPLQVGSRTFNDQPDGSYGQFIEGVSITSSGGGGRMIQLTQNERYRTNLGLANPLPHEVNLRVDFHRASGEALGTKTYRMPGLTSVFDTEVLTSLGHHDVADAYAVATSEAPEGAWVALASVVDNDSGDPVAQPALGEGGRHRVVSLRDVPLIRDHEWYDILFAEDVYVASGRQVLAWSRDGVSWHEGLTFEHNPGLRYLAWNGDQFLAVGSSAVYSSDDGISWSAAPVNGDGYDTVAWDGSQWVGLGGGGADWTEVGLSSDGMNWDQQRFDGIRLRNIIWAGDRFVAAGPSGLATSTDALSWQAIETFDNWVSDLGWNGRQLIALGAYEIYSTTDFEHFVGHDTAREPSEVVWAEDHWVVAAGTSANDAVDAFLISPDGVNWESVANPGPWLHPAEGMTWDGSTVLTVDFRRRLTWLVSDGAETTLPAVAHLNGHGGSSWRSDVELHNPRPDPLDCTLELVARDMPGIDPTRIEVTIGAASSLRLPDVLDTRFGFEGAGALTVDPGDGVIMVSSRTYADGTTGTYGQSVPGLRATDAIHGFETGRLIQLRHRPGLENGFRTNIGLVSRCRHEMEVVVDLHLGSGERVGAEIVVLPPQGAVQLNRVFDPWTDEFVSDGFAVLSTPTPRCAFFGYASVVDNRTHDPILVPARPWTPVP